MSIPNPRQLAFLALRDIYHKGSFTDIALDRVLQKVKLVDADRRLVTELVYGTVRRKRTLDALIDQLGKKKAQQQPPDLRIILHIGLYQLRYHQRIPAAAAVNTTVELAKENRFPGLAGVVNGLLRHYIRLENNRLLAEVGNRELLTGNSEAELTQTGLEKNFCQSSNQLNLESGVWSAEQDPLKLPTEPVQRLGILHSFPDWIVEMWIEQLGIAETAALCEWFNQSPSIDLRVNPLRTSVEEVESAMQAAGMEVRRLPQLPQALRLIGGSGKIQELPGFQAGWWTIQDSSAQLVSHLLDPQPDDVIIDACAAPGGKTTHIAELICDRGKIWACDQTASRLKKVKANAERLKLRSIEIYTGDSRNIPQFTNYADKVLLDAPCSGNGTLHRRPDIRWRTTPATVAELSLLQKELLKHTATWVKSGGILVYATCTLHPQENEAVIEWFLVNYPDWRIEIPAANSPASVFCTPECWIKVLPHREQMDGFFMVKLRKK